MGRDCLVEHTGKFSPTGSRVGSRLSGFFSQIGISTPNPFGELGTCAGISQCAEWRGSQPHGPAHDAGSKIVLVADYDCDGITSAAQMALFLTETGYTNLKWSSRSARRDTASPSGRPGKRRRGALRCNGLRHARHEARWAGLFPGGDCIVIDHHEVPDGKTARPGYQNPKHPRCGSTFKEFCASGLTLLFLAALRRAIRDSFPVPSLGGKYTALAAIGTVADLVPLVSANRILARSGLHSLNGASWPCASLLAGAAGITGKRITAGHISYHIGPRINAAGRVSNPRIAYDLLTADDPGELGRLAHRAQPPQLGAPGRRRNHPESHPQPPRGPAPEHAHPCHGRSLMARRVIGIAPSRPAGTPLCAGHYPRSR